MADLVIKVSGDVKSFTDALEKAEKRSEDLSEALSTTAKTAGIAFAALTAEIGLSVTAFNAQRLASNTLATALQNQGIFTEDLTKKYREYATAVQTATGLDDDAVVRSQATVQAFIGQSRVTKELTFAIADLSEAKKLDLDAAAELIGRGIAGQTTALKRLGIEIDDNLDKQGRMTAIIDAVNQKFGGQAAAVLKAQGGLRGLQNVFGDMQEEIGRRFAPIVDAVTEKLTNLFTFIANNPAIVDLGVSFIAAGAAVTGIITVVSLAGLAFLKLKAALEAAKIATTAMQIATKGLVAATGLGLLLVLVTEIYLNWESIWPRMQAIFVSFSNNITAIGSALGKTLYGVFSFNPALIKQGLAEAKEAFSKSIDDFNRTVDEKLKEREEIEKTGQERQNAQKKKAAEEATAIETRADEARLDRIRVENEIKLLEAENGSAQLIELKKKEIEALKELEQIGALENEAELIARAEKFRGLQEQQDELDKEQRRVLYDELLTINEDFNNLSEAQRELFVEQRLKKIQESVETEKSIQAQAAEIQLKEHIARNNKFLLEQQRFGEAYASINAIINSAEVQGAGKVAGQLTQLQSSKNKELKAIGKAASLTQIGIKTAEGAISAYSSLAGIPFVGPALGAAAAAALIAFGVEQAGNVLAANRGGIVTGGIPGIDSVPALLTPGELVVPQQNFDEVINATRSARDGGGGGGNATIELVLNGDLAEMVEARLIQRENLGISLRVING